ncbi:F-box protein SKIP17 [Raphanus sativus]|nr:F-box protein SKIP17 [Raphanus sativus]
MMDAPNTKRPRRHDDDATSSIQNPNSLPNFDLIVSSLLSSPSLSSSPHSFDQALDRALASASDNVSDQDHLVDRTVELASLLLDSTKRCFRKRASLHNSNSWAFPRELTIKMFSMLDKKSLMQAMACCTMFHKCARDPLCYSHIELINKNVDDGVVRTMIHRAGNKLRFLELGQVASPARSSMPLLTGSCLYPLFDNHSFIGDLGHGIKDRPLETIILRDCTSLKEKEVLQFLNSLLAGNLKFIRHIDVSNIRGLVCDGGKRSEKPNFPLEKLKEERPNVKLVAEFTSSLSSSERLLRGISYVSSDDEDALIVSDDDMEDFIVDQDDIF